MSKEINFQYFQGLLEENVSPNVSRIVGATVDVLTIFAQSILVTHKYFIYLAIDKQLHNIFLI